MDQLRNTGTGFIILFSIPHVFSVEDSSDVEC